MGNTGPAERNVHRGLLDKCGSSVVKKEEEEDELHVPLVNLHQPSVSCWEREYFLMFSNDLRIMGRAAAPSILVERSACASLIWGLLLPLCLLSSAPAQDSLSPS